MPYTDFSEIDRLHSECSRMEKAAKLGWLSGEKVRELAKPMLKNQYGQYLLRVIEEKKAEIDSDSFR